MRRSLPAFFLVLAACGGGGAAPERAAVAFDTPRGTFTVRAEVADDATERARGLMHRTSLGPNEGMLFLFEDAPAPRDFYMLNTLIPLDLVSIRAGRVVGVQRMVPCDDPAACETPITTTPPADAAVELSAGTAERAGITPGALVSSDLLP